jgi:hypothetical protein
MGMIHLIRLWASFDANDGFQIRRETYKICPPPDWYEDDGSDTDTIWHEQGGTSRKLFNKIRPIVPMEMSMSLECYCSDETEEKFIEQIKAIFEKGLDDRIEKVEAKLNLLKKWKGSDVVVFDKK